MGIESSPTRAMVVGFDFDLSPFIPFRDRTACARVRRIRKADLTRHPNPDFRIRIIEDASAFYLEFALDIVTRLRTALEAGKRVVAIFPVGPMPQYEIAARLINELRIPCHHLHSFNMDEYADEEGNTAPADWEGALQRAMMERFFLKIEEALRPPMGQMHFPTRDVLPTYGRMIEDLMMFS